MPNKTSVIARALQERIGWNKIGAAIGLVIVSISAIALYRLLDDVKVDKVISAIRAKSITDILIASVFVALGYVTLTFYEFFALRAIGRNTVPYRIAALASFTSYTIGHNLGATVFTGGLIRLRIYSDWGLSVTDVAKIAFITGLTFWLGNAFVLGASMAYAPEAARAVNDLTPWINRAIGSAGLLVIAGYLLWLIPCRRTIGRANWQVVLPNARLTLVQIGIGILDLGSGAAAMHVLLPSSPAIDFITLLVIFGTAMLLGFLSHAPGSLGVIEATMLIGLAQFQKDELLASLLLFRVLYFALPFLAAATLLGGRELWLMAGPATSGRD
jgi:glycosyltransferase 2 family protein